MKVDIKYLTETEVNITTIADLQELQESKQEVVKKLARQVKLAGFRPGKVPPALAEKHIEPNHLQSEVLNEIINKLYAQAIVENKLRVVSDPKIEIKKYVPFTNLEFVAEVEVIGKIKLPDYKNLKIAKQAVKVTDKEIEQVLTNLQNRDAKYNEVEREAKNGDRVTIDFEGKDSKGQAVKGATGKDYPLMLGSNTFIKGFEENIVGLEAKTDKSFTLTFPEDYHLKALQNKKVTFNVTVKKVEQPQKDPIDDKFAAKIGPFKTLKELKTDIEKHLKTEKEYQAQRDYEETIIKTIASKAKAALPQKLLDEQMTKLENEFKQSLSYRNQTIEEYLEANQLTSEQFKEKELLPTARKRLLAGLVLSEIAEREGIIVSNEEVEIRKQILKGKYSDQKMQEELAKPQATREVANQLLTEKTIAKLVSYTK